MGLATALLRSLLYFLLLLSAHSDTRITVTHLGPSYPETKSILKYAKHVRHLILILMKATLSWLVQYLCNRQHDENSLKKKAMRRQFTVLHASEM